MHYNFLYKYFFLVLLLSLTSRAYALSPYGEGESERRDTIDISQIVVTSTRTPRQLKDTPVLTRVITARDISKYGRTKLEDVLSSELAGIEFHQAGYGMTLSFQGLDARHILVLLNGEPLAGEVNGNIDFSRINIAAVERIEVVKGPAAVLYGSSSMGATINIITKEARDGFHGGAMVKFSPLNQKNSEHNGDINNIDSGGYLSYKHGSLAWIGDFKYQGSDPYRMVGTEMQKREYSYVDSENTTVAIPDNGIIYVPIDSMGIGVNGWELWGVNQRVGLDISPLIRGSIEGGYYKKTRYDLNSYDYYNKETLSNNYEGVTLKAMGEYDIADNQRLDYSYYLTTSQQQESKENNNTSDIITTPKQRHNLVYHRLGYLLRHSKGQLLVGAEYKSELLNYDLSEGGYDIERTSNQLSLYINKEYSINDKIEIVGGIRASLSDIQQPEGNNISFTPMVGVTYKNQSITYRANWAQGYRTPTLKERYITYYQSYMGSWIVGNDKLVAESNNYLSLSAEYFSPNNRLTLSVIGYINNFRDKIDTYYNEEKNSYIYYNTERTDIMGIELAGKLSPLDRFWLSAHYAYSYNNESAPTNSAQYIFTSPHTASFSGSYRINGTRGLIYDMSLTGRYVGAKDYEDRMPTILNYPDGSMGFVYGIYETYVKGYTMCDISLGISYEGRYRLLLGVDNILNYKPSVATFNAAVTSGTMFNASFSITF